MIKIFLIGLLPLLFIGCKESSQHYIENSEIVEKKEPFYQEQWILNKDKAFYDAFNIDENAGLNAEKAIKKYTGKGVKIAVIDINIQKDHIEFERSLTKVINSRDGSENIICNNNKVCYHGTAVSGLIVSDINGEGLRGVAPNSELIFIHLDLNGYISDSDILDSLIYAEKEDVDIVNLSWGTGDLSPIVEMKIKELSEKGRGGKGMIFVVAIGNDGKEQTNDESLIDSVISVGSTIEDNLRGFYSNYSEGLDIMAPGGYELGLTTTYIKDDKNHPSQYLKAEEYQGFKGTSASAPIVTGSLALLLEKYPDLTLKEVKERLYHTADKVGNIEYVNDRNDYYGHGKINVDKLLDMDNDTSSEKRNSIMN